MTADLQAASDVDVDLAREIVYRFLAAAVSDPRGARGVLVLDGDNQRLAHKAVRLLREEAAAADTGPGELTVECLTLTPLCAELTPDMEVETLRAEHLRVFGLVPARECPPHETEYHPPDESFFRAQQLADVAGFYRAFGLAPAQQLPERPDHLALELEFMAFLLTKKRLAAEAGDAEQAAVCADAQRSFFGEHLAWWVPAFAAGLRQRAGGGFYAELGRFLAAFVPAERQRLDVSLPAAAAQPCPEEPTEEAAGCLGCAGLS